MELPQKPLMTSRKAIYEGTQGMNEQDRIATQLRAMVAILPAPSDARRVRLATLACLQPGLLDGFLSNPDRAEWQRLMGHSAGVTQLVPPSNEAWGAAFNTLVSSAILDVSPDGKWGAGSGLNRSTLHEDDPYLCRASFAWSRLEGI